jgi:hypothetical protein
MKKEQKFGTHESHLALAFSEHSEPMTGRWRESLPHACACVYVSQLHPPGRIYIYERDGAIDERGRVMSLPVLHQYRIWASFFESRILSCVTRAAALMRPAACCLRPQDQSSRRRAWRSPVWLQSQLIRNFYLANLAETASNSLTLEGCWIMLRA